MSSLSVVFNRVGSSAVSVRRSIRALSTLAPSPVVDTTQAAKAIEQAGVPAKQSEAITSTIISLVNELSREEMDRFHKSQDHSSNELQEYARHRDAELELTVYKRSNVAKETMVKELNEIKSRLDKKLRETKASLIKDLGTMKVKVKSFKNDHLQINAGAVFLMSALCLALGFIVEKNC